MEKKVIIAISIVAVVAIAGAAAAVVLLNNNNNNNSKPAEVTANSYAQDFCKNYKGIFGDFTVSEGATDDVAVVTSTVKQYIRLSEDTGTRDMSVKITRYGVNDVPKFFWCYCLRGLSIRCYVRSG